MGNMEEQEFDEPMMRDILDWLGRCVDPEEEQGSMPEFTEEDCIFLRESGIAIPC